MINLLFQIVIQPIYMLLELLYKFFFDATSYNIIPTIFLLSFMVSVFCLPLYLRADAISEEERLIRKKLEPRIKSIKTNFKGDEKHLLLQTYYRQNGYHPVMSLRLSFSLLLQIPFFFAAYCFFTHLDLSNYYIFGFIENLSKPDSCFRIGELTINTLPILMTLVNIEAGFIYAKSKSFKENLNLYIISLVFLVLLYNQPAGLVLYWLFNNIFSLIKNILLKITTPEVLLKNILVFTLFVFYFGFKHFHFGVDTIIVGIFSILLARFSYIFNITSIKFEAEKLYWICLCAFVILTGLFIPSNVIASSPMEFLSDIVHPLQILEYPFFNSVGIFIFWGGVIWMLADKKLRKILGGIACLIFIFAVINMLLIPMPKAILLNNLNFDAKNVSFFFEKMSDKLIYIFVLLFAFTTSIFLIIKNKIRIIKNIIIAMIFTGLLLSGYNILKINNQVKVNKSIELDNTQEFKKYFNFSKTKKNVLVIFMDRAVSSFFKLLLQERPELNQMYSGFTYYPNTLSFYRATSFAYPPIMGGYEYTPLEFAKSKDTYDDMHNKAISVLPLIFKRENWDVTITDTPWFDYEIKFLHPDKVYTDNGINYKPFKQELSSYCEKSYNKNGEIYTFALAKRNFIFYALSVIVPGRVRKYVYNRGRYLKPGLVVTNVSKEFIVNYGILKILNQLTDFHSKNNTFMVINSDITHTTALLKFPEYKFVSSIELKDQTKNQIYKLNNESLMVYHTFAAGILMFGKYLDFLKKNGVYDNTRIIIVSDHGMGITNSEINDKFYNEHTIKYHPLLLVKDFNQQGNIKISDDFMTNADTPQLAIRGLISNPINPYTNKSIVSNIKQNGVYIMQADYSWQPKLYIGKRTVFQNSKNFSYIKNNIFERGNWEIDIPYPKIKQKEGIK